MERLSDGRHGVRQPIQPPGVQTQTSIGHVPAKHGEVHQIPGPSAEEPEPGGLTGQSKGKTVPQ